jgi:hypothetical protein
VKMRRALLSALLAGGLCVFCGCSSKQETVNAPVATNDPSGGFKPTPGAAPKAAPGPGQIDPAQQEALNKEAGSAGK